MFRLLPIAVALIASLQVNARQLVWSEPVPVSHFNVYFTRDLSKPVREWDLIASPTDPSADMPIDGPCGYFTVSAVSASGEEVFTQIDAPAPAQQVRSTFTKLLPPKLK